jgi:hypothetical protein
MALPGLPSAAQSLVDSYNLANGCYRREDGSLDPCPTELETLGVWRDLARCIKPKVIVETGVMRVFPPVFFHRLWRAWE